MTDDTGQRYLLVCDDGLRCVCQRCGKIVQVDKRLFGPLHLCLPGRDFSMRRRQNYDHLRALGG